MITKRNLRLFFCMFFTILTVSFFGFLIYLLNKISRTGVYGYAVVIFLSAVSVLLLKNDCKVKLWLIFSLLCFAYFGVGICLYLLIFKGGKSKGNFQKVGLYARKSLILKKEVTSAVYFSDCKNLWDSLFFDIENASKEVYFFSYIFNFGEYGAKLISLFYDLLNKGVSVKIGVDYFGSGDIRGNEQIKSLKKRGAEITVKNIPKFLILPKDNRRVHAKICIVDGKTIYLTSANLDDISIGKDKNCGVKLSGRLENAVDVFGRLWNIKEKDCRTENSINDNLLKKSILDEPNLFTLTLSCGSGGVKEIIVAMLFKAQKSVKIVTPYFSLDETVFNAITIAVKRGVKITVAIPGTLKSKKCDKVTLYYAKKASLKGVKVVSYQEEFLHAKMIVCDDCIAVCGSCNFDTRSFDFATEGFLISTDNGLIAAFLKDFNGILVKSKEIDFDKENNNKIVDGILSLLSPLV